MLYALAVIGNALIGYFVFYLIDKDIFSDFWDLFKIDKENQGDVFGLERNRGKQFKWSISNVFQYFILVLFLPIVITIITSLWAIIAIIGLVALMYNKIKDLNYKKEKKETSEKDKIRKANYKGYEKAEPNIIAIKKKLLESNSFSFDIKTNQVIYFENEYNTLINEFFIDNYQEVVSWFKNMARDDVSYEFIYIPRRNFLSDNEHISKDLLRYNLPWITEIQIDQLKKLNITTSEITDEVLKSIGYKGEIYPGLFRIKNKANDNFDDIHFSYYRLPFKCKATLYNAIWAYLDNIGERNDIVRYRLVGEADYKKNGETYQISDLKFNYEASKIAVEIEEKVSQLSIDGYEQVLLSILSRKLPGYKIIEQQVENRKIISSHLSRLHIDNNFKIWLSDYDNIEIHLTPLPKTLFFLFLRHEEGILLKHICDHKDEIMEIYKVLSYRESHENIVESINNVIDPTKNSINEKASRIKEAFVKHLKDDIAKNYYITGGRGEQKKILLNRELIKWDSPEISWPFKKSKSIEDSENDEKSIKELYNNGLIFLDEKKYDLSINAFSEIIELYPYYYKAYAMRALCYLDTHQYDKAEEDNNLADSLNEAPNIHHHNRSEARLMLKKYDEALEDINTFLQGFDNKCNESYFIRGLIYMEKGMIDSARQDWHTAESLGHKDAQKYLQEHPGKRITKAKLEPTPPRIF